MRKFKNVTVNKKAEALIKSGHPWVYGEEITEKSENIAGGEIIDVFSSKKRYLGSGFYNPVSKISVRIISDNANDKFDKEFFRRRIKYAIAYRKTVMGADFSSCRLIFGDSDLFPGFIADKFGSVLVTQIMCLGIEKIKDMLFSLIIEEMKASGDEISVIYERNDAAVREKEGLTLYKGIYYGVLPENGMTRINENGVLYDVDFINGQKTGFFLDQKYNRKAAAAIAKDKTVLDCFTHTGAFAMNCAKNGAKFVTAVDISKDAVQRTEENIKLNNLSNIEVKCENVFDFLQKLHDSGNSPYDYIILDPPAFTKSRTTVNSAYKGYKEINLKAMKILPRGGYLATCSCSHFMTDELFRKMLFSAAQDAKVKIRIIEYRQQAADHPVLMGVPETEYLGFYIVQVI